MRNALIALPLVLLAVALAVWDGLAFRIAGYKPLAHLEARDLDEPASLDDRQAPRFLEDRDHLELEVPRDMPLGELLRLYQLGEMRHIRQQIAKQEGAPDLPDDHPLKKGKRYRITLTPPSEGMP